MTTATKHTATRLFEQVTTRANGTCECCGEREGTRILARTTSNTDTLNALLLACDNCWDIAQTSAGLVLGHRVLDGNDVDLVPYFRRVDSTWRAGGVPVVAQAAVEYLELTGQMKTGIGWAY